MRADLVCGAVLLAVVAVFAVQRDYNDRISGTFPDVVLVAITLLGLWIIGSGLRGLRVSERTRVPRSLNLPMLAATCGLLLAWGLGMALIGFTLASVLAFVVMTTLIRRGRPRPKLLALDTVVGTAVCVGFFLIFTRVLLVPLPVSTILGM